MTDAIPLRRDRAPVAAHETVAQRVQSLQAEAKTLARSQVEALLVALSELEHEAKSIADGGDVYTAGARGVAREIARDCQSRALTLQQIIGRES